MVTRGAKQRGGGGGGGREGLEAAGMGSAAAESVAAMKKRHERELARLKLSSEPRATLKYFLLAVLRYVQRLLAYVASHRSGFLSSAGLVALLAASVVLFEGPHRQYVTESLLYFRFVVWWVALGVASSIGCGSGLHTFVLYLGPHIAKFTIMATEYGRVDLKKAPYDTPQWGLPASWHNLDNVNTTAMYPRVASDHGGYMVPLHHILLQVIAEAMLWGLGTALGELPPYFLSRAARMSGERVKDLEDLVQPVNTSKIRVLDRLKHWFLSHSQNLGFFTILIFASVPNPLFDLAGITCGHFQVPFWKFFLATLIGKALIKTHIQTLFIIVVCNAHTLELLRVGLEWVGHRFPVFSRYVPYILSVLYGAREGFISGKKHTQQLSRVLLCLNTISRLILGWYAISIVNSTAQIQLKEEQRHELDQQANIQSANGSTDSGDGCEFSD